ncbi:hypothetical protein CPC08DRAFT_749490 [Agrocybe pediades]|nr:hypothetical protein CPC08DRAFT_749490 [Agrocybe pediades]
MAPGKAQKVLVANRGEIALRIIRTAKRLGIETVAIYTASDALSPHVLQADEAVALPPDASSETAAYLNISSIISICRAHSVTLVHPGYGFLSENAEFATQVLANGIIWLGPQPEVIHRMGIKHEARKIVLEAGVEVVPGSEGLVKSEEEAIEVARRCGFPVMLKATAGGGGMGMVVCHDEGSLRSNLRSTQERAKSLFHNEGVFLEKYFSAARHVEVQVFGNGLGDAIHLRERECSVQRRHQKVIEESPSPFCSAHPGLRERMCEVAINLARSIHYNSAGTIEFIVDEHTANFYFLEMNTRIQVEHPVTEEIHSGLDIVEMMIKQGLAEQSPEKGLSASALQQSTYDELFEAGQTHGKVHSIEGRVYAENPYENFVPSPGLLQHVSLYESKFDWLRVDGWVETGLTVSPNFDPLLAKVIVTGSSREEAIYRFKEALRHIKVSGPPNNIQYLNAIAESDTFAAGKATTKFLDSFDFSPRAFKVLSSGLDTSIQDLPGRTLKLGIPRSGPMDELAFSLGNLIVGNPKTTEGLEFIVVPGVPCSFQFFTETVVAVTGKDVTVKIDGVVSSMWAGLVVPSKGKITIEAKVTDEPSGFRNCLCVKGGFPDVPVYLGSKSTSMGLGGYQGRSLLPGDYISLGNCAPQDSGKILSLPQTLIPSYPSHWVVYVLPGPHDDEEFVTKEGIKQFYSTHWRVSPSSNRLGIRLEAPTSSDTIQWARKSGGEGGSHPSNILDNGYAPGTININGDTPVILTNEGPDMGGYLCMCTVATSDMWKLGQLAPGCTVQFRRVSWNDARRRVDSVINFVSTTKRLLSGGDAAETQVSDPLATDLEDIGYSPILYVHPGPSGQEWLKVTFRQAGDGAVLVEFGGMHLDILVRARIHAFQTLVKEKNVPGILSLCPCIRSILCYFDPEVINQDAFMKVLLECERSIPEDMNSMTFPGRRITFPIVLDDKWNREALERYMATARDKASYLPSNIEYLAKNNGLSDSAEALRKLMGSDWLILGVGFYFACPFLVPIDPRCRLVGQKMNPSRTFTPRGAIGIAGPVAAIYPVESPGGYQLFGRTLPGWQTWGKGREFKRDKPWLLEAFDQITFVEVSEDEYVELEKRFDAGQYVFKVENVEFSVAEHLQFLESIQDELKEFHAKQAKAVVIEEEREKQLLQEWEEQKAKSSKQPGAGVYDDGSAGGTKVTASVFATIWKFKCQPGDIITSESQVLAILEAMKTEIPITAGETNVGKKVKSFVSGKEEGSSVRPGDAIFLLE